MKMQHDLLDASIRESNINVYIPKDYEFVFNPEIAEFYNVICGHFARNPIDVIKDLTTFSMVREPFNQYLSSAKYAAQQSGSDFTEEFLDNFLNNDNNVSSYFEGMSGCDNPQSCFLYSKIACFEVVSDIDLYGNPPEQKYKSFFVDKPQSYSALKDKLDGIIIGRVENRKSFVNKMNEILFNLYGIKIENNESVINSTPAHAFKISNKHKNKINSKIQLDLELYAKIRESERIQ